MFGNCDPLHVQRAAMPNRRRHQRTVAPSPPPPPPLSQIKIKNFDRAMLQQLLTFISLLYCRHQARASWGMREVKVPAYSTRCFLAVIILHPFGLCNRGQPSIAASCLLTMLLFSLSSFSISSPHLHLHM